LLEQDRLEDYFDLISMSGEKEDGSHEEATNAAHDLHQQQQKVDSIMRETFHYLLNKMR
jgi:hypothetical protein